MALTIRPLHPESFVAEISGLDMRVPPMPRWCGRLSRPPTHTRCWSVSRSAHHKRGSTSRSAARSGRLETTIKAYPPRI